MQRFILSALAALLPATAIAEIIKTTSVPVPTDSKARYTIVIEDVGHGKSALAVISKREGPSGTSFAIREVNCITHTFRYLGEGDTLEEAMDNLNDRAKMSALVDGSISDYISRAACK